MNSSITAATGIPDTGLATIPEVALALRVSRTKVYRLMDGGAIEYIKLGALRRIPWAGVHQLVRNSARTGPISIEA